MNAGTVIEFIRDVVRVRRGREPRKALTTVVWLNTICNLRCSYCYIGKDDRGFPQAYRARGLPLPAIKKVLRAVRKASHGLTLIGGEPFLRVDLKEILRFCKEDLRFVDICVVTNGLLLKERQDCLPHIDHLAVSYDATRCREYPEAMEKLLADVSELKRKRVLIPGQVFFICTFQQGGSLEGWAPFLGYARNHNLKIIAQPCRDGKGDVADWEAFNGIMARISREYGARLLLNNPLLAGCFNHQTKFSTCIPRGRLCVDVNGNLVYPCEKFSFQQAGRLTNDSDIDELWRSAAERHGLFPSERCARCGLACYWEATVLFKHPFRFLLAILRNRLRRGWKGVRTRKKVFQPC